MTDEFGHLLVAIFEDEDAVEAALAALKEARKTQVPAVQALATVSRGEDGELQIKETADPGGPRGALAGGLIGALIGLLGGPGGAIVAGAAGALVGGVTARIIDSGIPDHSLTIIGQSLLAGDVAIVLIVDEAWRDQTEALMVSAGARVMTGSLTSVIAEQLQLPPELAEVDGQDQD
jgi:uncharacterized membrane protein